MKRFKELFKFIETLTVKELIYTLFAFNVIICAVSGVKSLNGEVDFGLAKLFLASYINTVVISIILIKLNNEEE